MPHTRAIACLLALGASVVSAARAPAQTSSAPEHLKADTPKQTVAGTTFIAPADWTYAVRGPATILTAPEGDSRIALVDVGAPSADSAVALAWAAYLPGHTWPLKVVTPEPDQDGWSERSDYTYQTSPNEKRGVGLLVQRAGNVWTVVVYDMSDATGEKRLAAVQLIYDRLLPKGFTRESFAGRKAATLDAAHLARLSAFTERAMRELGVPGAAVGIVNVGGFLASLSTMTLIGFILDRLAPGGPSTYTVGTFKVAMSAQYLVWGLGLVQILRYRRKARRGLRESDPEAYAALRAGESIVP